MERDIVVLDKDETIWHDNLFPGGQVAQWTKPDRNTSFLEQFWHSRRKKRLLRQGARSYKNPHLSEIDSALILKDLYLLRWLLAPETFRSLRMILVSDAYDVKNLASHPQTPQILVAPDGTWLSRQRVDQLLDVLFSNPDHPPHEIFDNLLGPVHAYFFKWSIADFVQFKERRRSCTGQYSEEE